MGVLTKYFKRNGMSIYSINKNLSSELSRNQFNHDEGYTLWIVESIKLMPAAFFVWKDNFETAFNAAYDRFSLNILNEREGDRELNFSPYVTQELQSIVMEGFVNNCESAISLIESAVKANVSDNLVILNQASAKFWANADPKDNNTHPLNVTVSAWLEGQGYNKSLAAKGATIIRPEWATTGRKTEQ